MAENNFDIGSAEDFDIMTFELGREVKVYPRDNVLEYEGFEGDESGLKDPVTEYAFIQELDSEHEMKATGQLNIANIRFVFQSTTIAEEEGYVIDGENRYKILKLTKVHGQSHNVPIYVKGVGKKVPLR